MLNKGLLPEPIIQNEGPYLVLALFVVGKFAASHSLSPQSLGTAERLRKIAVNVNLQPPLPVIQSEAKDLLTFANLRRA